MAVTSRFDTLFPATLTGEITTMTVIDPDGTPNHVLELDRPWRVALDFQLAGSNSDTIAGAWHVSLRVESMGVEFEGEVASATINLAAVQAGSTPVMRLYHTDLNIPAGTIVEEGIYRPVVLITYKNAAGSPRPMAGFAEHALITFYQDQP